MSSECERDYRAEALLEDRIEMLAAMVREKKPSQMSTPDPDSYTYRVSIRGSRIKITCFGVPTVDDDCEGEYDGADDLPDWVQDRLAILMMTPIDKPTSDIRGVGRRISKDVFWVYAPKAPSEDKS